MQPLDVVLLQRDQSAAGRIVSALTGTSASVHQIQSLDELRSAIARYRASIAIVDMEVASISDVEHLSREFPKACLVCTHRLADDRMWTAALNAGASDICPPSDTTTIVRVALKNRASAQSAAA